VIERDAYKAAFVYIFGSVAFGGLALWAGMTMMRGH
jgi:hypothetical protein